MSLQEVSVLEGEAGFRALFQYATVRIVVIGREGRIELVNPCALDLFGYEPGELVGKPLEILIPGDLRKEHEHHRNNYFKRPKARPMGYGMDLYAQKKDGKIFPVEISLGHSAAPWSARRGRRTAPAAPRPRAASGRAGCPPHRRRPRACTRPARRRRRRGSAPAPAPRAPCAAGPRSRRSAAA